MKNKNFIFGVICLLFMGIGSLQAQYFNVTGSAGYFEVEPTLSPFNGTVLLGSMRGDGNGAQFRYDNDDNDGTGFFDIGLNGDGNFVIENSDNQSFVMDQSGNVGIGTTTPNAKLSLSNGTLPLEIRPGEFFNGTNFVTQNGTASFDVPFMGKISFSDTVIFTQPNVGIGTIIPTQALDVVGNIKASGGVLAGTLSPVTDVAGMNTTVIVAGNSRNKFINFRGGGSPFAHSGAIFSTYNDHFFVHGNGQNLDFRFSNQSSDAPNLPLSALMRFTSTGNLGLGNITPAFQLELSTNSAAKPGSNTWTISSDKRLKKDVKSFTDGLEVLEKIRPVYFHYNGKAGLPTEEEYVGIIAQEMQEIAPYMIKPYTYESEDGTEEEYLSYDANALFYILVNSVQEQQDEIEAKDAVIQELKERLAKLEALVQQLASDSGKVDISFQTTTLTDAALLQNQPNPFTEETMIRYFIPNTVKRAELRITDINGKVLKAVAIDAKGEGQTTLQAQSLSSGTYLYSLVLDGVVQDTKKMVLTK